MRCETNYFCKTGVTSVSHKFDFASDHGLAVKGNFSSFATHQGQLVTASKSCRDFIPPTLLSDRPLSLDVTCFIKETYKLPSQEFVPQIEAVEMFIDIEPGTELTDSDHDVRFHVNGKLFKAHKAVLAGWFLSLS
jgi:hypothetical protein